ncbi:VWA domain-containing protein [Streptomyces hawaiiensis]|uniref:VWA domain-containing protein n=1 Tax=Streptomyces hawaiiensis TaxID=67305 RepID=UPI0036522D43
MGILTRLRNAFGRSRKTQTAEAEGAAQTTPTEPTTSEDTPTAPAATPRVPSPSPEPTPAPTANVPEPRDDEHDLVSAAFDKVAVPRPAGSTESEPPATEGRKVAEEPTVEEKAPQSEATSTETPVAEEPPVPAEEKSEREKSPAPAETTEKPEITPATEERPEPEAAKKAAEPKAAEPQTEAEAEPKTAEPKAEAEAEPKTAAEPKATKAAEAEPKTAEPQAEAEAEPKTAEPQAAAETAAPEPAAADGDAAPQGPPAPDDETSTGGAGGNKTTEGEAEAKPKRKPAPKAKPKAEPKAKAEPKPGAEAAKKPETQPEPEAAAEPKPDAGPALPLTRVKTRAPSLTTAYKAAATTLESHNLTGTRAKVYLVLDRSASMRPYYKDGSAQALAEQTLALAAHLDPEATVPVVFFSTELDGTGEIPLTDHENKIDDLHASLGRMGRTSYHAAVEAVLAHHDKTKADPTTPALVIFQTDGAPDAKTPATQALTDAAKSHPAVFFSFVAFGDPENKAFDYLRKLKTPNTSHFLAGETPRELTDKELYEGVLANWRP